MYNKFKNSPTDLNPQSLFCGFMAKRKEAPTLLPKKIKFTALTEGQTEYWNCLNQNEILFCDGPPGSGKSFIAACKGVDMLLKEEVQKFIICRPAVVTSEKGQGFLPGNIYEKLELFMRPIVEEICKAIDLSLPNSNEEFRFQKSRGYEFYRKFVQEGKISIESLDHVRGNNFHDCFMLLDEAQNSNRKQINAFVSRMGQNSRVVVCGDSNQTDLRSRKQLYNEKTDKWVWREVYCCDFFDMWEEIEEREHDTIGVCELTRHDIVRSGILKDYFEIVEQ
jgi:phosphate starvation-inducible PhoH-like protein